MKQWTESAIKSAIGGRTLLRIEKAKNESKIALWINSSSGHIKGAFHDTHKGYEFARAGYDDKGYKFIGAYYELTDIDVMVERVQLEMYHFEISKYGKSTQKSLSL